MKLDLTLHGGQVVTGRGISRVDLGIRDGKIVRMEPLIPRTHAVRAIDVSGKLVLPGVVDVHVHPIYMDDLAGTSVAAACGGVTSMIHFAYARPGDGVLSTLERFKLEGESSSLLDFGLHAGLFDVQRQIEEVPAAMTFGVSSFKVFLTYAKLKWMTDDYWLTALADVLSQRHGLLMVHAENGLATDYLEDKILREARSPLQTFTSVRPDLLEAEAINRAAAIAHTMGCALYVVHVSAAACLDPLQRAHRLGWRVFAETCPQYLVLSDETTQRLGPLAKIGPPLRLASDQEALWRGLVDGTLVTIGSDHAPKQKRPDEDFFEASFGAPQIETMLSVVYHRGVNGGRITLPKLVEVMSEAPARLFGLYPDKGTIAVGSDADVVVFDPQRSHVLTAAEQRSAAGYTLYEGMEVLGMPILTMQRGDVIVEHGEVQTRAGRARFLPTRTSHLYDPV